MPNLAHHIDRFFGHHGSPMAGLGNLFVRFGQRYGVDPRELAAIAMKETEGGLTGTGRSSQGYGAFGVGPRTRYPGYPAAIKDAARNLGGPRYRGKPLNVQTAMWVAGTPPSASTAGYTRDIRTYEGMLGGGGPNTFQTPKAPRTIRTPGQPAIPGIKGTTLPNPTPLLQSLGDIVGMPWSLQLPDVQLPGIPGIPAQPGQRGSRGRPPPGTPSPATQLAPGNRGIYTKANLGRTDQGVDFVGSGPIPALAYGKITRVVPHGGPSGWPGGGFIVIQLARPVKVLGHLVRYYYVGENIVPHVKVGQRVRPGQVLATALGSSPYTEQGWAADSSGGTLAKVTGGYTEGQVTPAGRSFLKFLGY